MSFNRSFPRTGSILDNKIKSTDFDALSSKYSAYQLGYLDDPYLEMTVENAKSHLGRSSNNIFVRKMPVINRGTFLRHFAISEIVNMFFARSEGPVQLISLGAGSDTRAFESLKSHPYDLIYHEIDFEDACKRKVNLIRKNEILRQIVDLPDETSDSEPTEIHTKKYHLHARDLRELSGDSPLFTGMVTDRPTLIISECCLCYMSPEDASDTIEWITKNISSNLSIVLYEPIIGTDSFGQIMFKNLTDRGVSKNSLRKFPSGDSQVQRLFYWGFKHSSGAPIGTVDGQWISSEIREKMRRVEVLDEREEFNLLVDHYCILWGSTTLIFKHSGFPYTFEP